MPTPRQLKRTQTLLAAVLGLPAKPTRKFERVLKALHAGREVVIELPWSPGPRYHQLTLHRVEGERIFFTNSDRIPGMKAGMILSGPLPRRIEPGGMESSAIADLQHLFEEGKGEGLVI
jgi:hypothetical protein